MSDLSSTGWTTIFKMGGKAMSLPEELTRKWWDKKKQLVAKTHATGIGDELDKLKPLLEKVDWVWLSANPNAKAIDVERAKAMMNSGALKSLITQLREVRDLAKKEAVVMKKGTLTKKTGEVLEEIATVADHVAVACNANSLSSALADALKDWDKQIREKFVKAAQPTVDAVGLVIKKLGAEEAKIMEALKQFVANPNLEFNGQTHRGVLGNLIRDLCRDMTQPLGNLMKSAKAGVPFTNYDGNKIDTLYKAISAISNTKGTEFMEKLDGKGAVNLVSQVKQWTQSFKELTEDVKIA